MRILVWKSATLLHSGLTIMSDVKEMQVREHANKIEELEDTILDLDGTIGQFRELVTQLQK